MRSPSRRSASSEPETTKPDARRLAEEDPLEVVARAEIEHAADPARQARLRDRHEEAALGDVVGARQVARAHRVADRLLHGAQRRDVDRRQPRRQLLAAQLRELRPGEVRAKRPREADRVAGEREARPPRALRDGQLADHADDRRRVDRAAAALVVERDVAADDRHVEAAARVGQAADRLGELPRDVRLLGVAEVQAVRQAERLGAHAREVGARTRAPPRPCPCTGRTRRAAPTRRSRPRSRRRRPAAASTAASACSGRRTVRDCTMQSYC